jgi:hypothetical protein
MSDKSAARRQQNLKDRIRRYLWDADPGDDGTVTVSVQKMAEVMSTAQEAARSVFKGLIAETGSGVTQIGPSIYSYRRIENTRKPQDMAVRLKIHRFMMEREPGAWISVAEVADALGTARSSTSSVLNTFDRDSKHPVFKVTQGVYDRIPVDPATDYFPGVAAAMARVAAAGQATAEEERVSAAPTLRPLTETELGLARGEGARIAVALNGAQAQPPVVAWARALGIYLATTDGGTVLVQDGQGAVYELRRLS